MSTPKNKLITDLVDKNYIYASVLYYFGIEFYHYSQHTLEQACIEKGLDVRTVVSRLERLPQCRQEIDIDGFPIDLIVEYLKHTHFLFIKQKLPYLSKVIDDLPDSYDDHVDLVKDLKFVFPLFTEDFIHHIYKEEDTLFNYIVNLQKFVKEGGNISAIYYNMEQNSLTKFAKEHEEHDDEMAGIRKITDNYRSDRSMPLHIKVIFEELKALDKELRVHANVEDEVLFPKALALEREAREQLRIRARFN